jgi:peptidyl-prolyl cis-trans isomerase B (cyclophilin B)
MNALVSTMLFVSVLFPQKGWFTPDQPINIRVKAAGEINLFLTDFTGKAIETKGSTQVQGEQTIDLKQMFPPITTPNTYVLYAVPKGNANKDFTGTPLVIGVRQDQRRGAPSGPLVVKVEPLCYVAMTTDKGAMMIAMYYDAAPNTVANFLSLVQSGFYDGIGFHRIVKDFVIQGGDSRWADPQQAGTGGPGYMTDAEFNDRRHEEGVLSMARSGDPNEPGAMPRCEFANSAGSQFFVCLNYDNTKQLDKRYTAFGKVVDGIDTVRAIAAVPLVENTDRPQTPPKILKAEVKPVTAKENPYATLLANATAPLGP